MTSILPGWDSLKIVGKTHDWLEWASIIFLALVVIVELIAQKYSQRKDELENIETDKSNRLIAAANEATEKLRKQNLELQMSVEKERIKRLELEKRYEWRTLTDAQIKDFASRLTVPGLPRRSVDIFVFNLSPEIANLEQKIVGIFSYHRHSRWNEEGP